MSEVKRTYDSSRRREAAARTRERLIAGARKLFAEKGYTATTVEAIAREAGSAPATFYKVLGSKRGVLLALLDGMPIEVDLEGLGDALDRTTDPVEQLTLLVDFRVRLYTSAYDILETVRAAAPSDPEAATIWATGESRRRASQAELLRAWHRGGALRAELSVKEADDILWSLTGPDVYRVFVSEAGWAAEEYRRWLTRTVRTLLMG